MGWIDWKGYRAQGSTDRPPVSDHSELTGKDRTWGSVHQGEGSQASDPAPQLCLFTPAGTFRAPGKMQSVSRFIRSQAYWRSESPVDMGSYNKATGHFSHQATASHLKPHVLTNILFSCIGLDWSDLIRNEQLY